MENQEQTHKRRVRYKGTHPRNYKEKYKELQPEKYADTVAKVVSKGSTPAGMHISISFRSSRGRRGLTPRLATAAIPGKC